MAMSVIALRCVSCLMYLDFVFKAGKVFVNIEGKCLFFCSATCKTKICLGDC